MASFLESNFGFEFGAKTCLFWSLWQIISAWLVLEAAGCEQSGCPCSTVVLQAWFRQLSSEINPLPQAALWWCIHELTHAAFQASRRCNGKCQHDIEKTGVWSLLLAWWRMKRVTCFAVWRMELYDSMLDVRLGYASICKRVAGHTHWRSFFGAAAFLVVLDRLCFFWWKPFLASISGRPLLLFH